MLSRRRFGRLGLTFALLLLLAPALAWAQAADKLRANGLAGERLDGYMEARDASVKAEVAKINAERKKIYEQRAQQQGVPAEEVAKVYAQQIISQAPPGTWIMTKDGKWVKK